MQETDILWDRLAGTLKIYGENFLIYKSGGGKRKLSPSYSVDYEIEEEIISGVSGSYENGDIQSRWYLQVSTCRNINDLPLYFKKLVKQFLPRFFRDYPQYQGAECLRTED